MAERAPTLDRMQMLRALPRHLFYALVLGAIAGAILYWLQRWEAGLSEPWNLLVQFAMGAIFANAAIGPVALPGRHWAFSFIGALMLILLLVAAVILSRHFVFSHADFSGWPYRQYAAVTYPNANLLAHAAIVSGACLGLFYGVLCGRTGAMVAGLSVGSAAGYTLGVMSCYNLLFQDGGGSPAWPPWRSVQIAWRFDGTLHFAWQLALALALLHLGAGLGAAMGAGSANPRTAIQNPK